MVYIALSLSGVLLLIALWKEDREGELDKLVGETQKFQDEKGFFNKLFFFLYSLLYWLRGFIIRQLLNPYIFFTFLLIFIAATFFKNYPNDGTKLQFYALIITFFAILWYSRETLLLREEQSKNNQIQERPILNLYLRRDKKTKKRIFKLRNIGRGPAYNIVIEKFKLKGYSYSFFIDEPNAILERNKDEKSIRPYVQALGGGVESSDTETFIQRAMLKTLDSEAIEKEKKQNIIFLIKYDSIREKDTYYSIFRFYSKLSLTEDLIIEFIKSGKGKCAMKEAEKLCNKKEKFQSIYSYD